MKPLHAVCLQLLVLKRPCNMYQFLCAGLQCVENKQSQKSDTTDKKTNTECNKTTHFDTKSVGSPWIMQSWLGALESVTIRLFLVGLQVLSSFSFWLFWLVIVYPVGFLKNVYYKCGFFTLTFFDATCFMQDKWLGTSARPFYTLKHTVYPLTSDLWSFGIKMSPKMLISL